MMEARKLAMITGWYANTNLDDDKGTRSKMIHDLEEQFATAIRNLYEPVKAAEEEDPFTGVPLFEGMKIPGANLSDEEIARALGEAGVSSEPSSPFAGYGAPKPYLPLDLDVDIDQT